VIALWSLTALAFGFFLLLYDQDLFQEDTCKVLAATLVNADYRQPELLQLVAGEGGLEVFEDEPELHGEGDQAPFLLRHYGQRLGPSVLISPLLALFGTFGFRLVYALQGLLLPGLGFLLGRSVLGRGWPAWTVAVALTFSPYALELQTFDENILACCFGTLALVLLLRSPPAPWFAGMAMGLFLGIRHVGLLLLPVVLFYLWRKAPDRARAVGVFCLAAGLLGLPYLVLHAAMFAQDGVLFESAADSLDVSHSVFGFEFTLPVFLNFPFVPQPLRSPYGVFAPLVAFPLDLLDRFGLFAAALVPAGLAQLFGRDRTRATLLVLWFGLILAVLMVQSSWTEPNKMGIPATVLAPAVLAVVAGAVLLVRTRHLRLRLGWIVLGLAPPLLALAVCRTVEMPLDPRMFEYEPDADDALDLQQHATLPRGLLRSDESEPYLAWERARYRPRPLPHLRLRQLHPARIGLRARQLYGHLREPRVRDYSRPVVDAVSAVMLGPGMQMNPISLMKVMERGPSPGGLYPVELFDPGSAPPDRGHRDLDLDLSEPPSLSAAPFTAPDPLDRGDALDLETGQALLLEGLEVDFDPRPENLFAARDRHGTVFLVLLPGEVGTEGSPEWLPLDRIDGEQYPDRTVPLRLPVGAVVRIFDVRNYHPATPAPGHPRVYLRTAVVGRERIWLSQATPTSVF